MPFKRGSESGEVEVEVAVHAPELAARLEHPSGAPAQRHLPVPPALDVLGVLATDPDHRLDRVGRSQRPGQGRREVEAEHGQRLGEALAQAAGGTWVGLVQLPCQCLEQRLGLERGAGVIGRARIRFATGPRIFSGR